MKWIRTLKFRKIDRYIGGYGLDTTFRTIKDTVLTNYALAIAPKYGCKIRKFECDLCTCYIEILASRDCFLAFINDFVKNFEDYIDYIHF